MVSEKVLIAGVSIPSVSDSATFGKKISEAKGCSLLKTVKVKDVFYAFDGFWAWRHADRKRSGSSGVKRMLRNRPDILRTTICVKKATKSSLQGRPPFHAFARNISIARGGDKDTSATSSKRMTKVLRRNRHWISMRSENTRYSCHRFRGMRFDT
jgi:hypothetical protein